MKINLYLLFRSLPDIVKSILPPAFEQIVSDFEISTNGTESMCDILVDPDIAEGIVYWGRTIHNGKAIVRIARFNDVYELQDLDGHDLVEIFFRASFSAPYARINNYSKSFKSTWACTNCMRVNVEQVDDIAVSLDRRWAVQQSDNYLWFVSRDLAHILEEYGCKLRPLKRVETSKQWVIKSTLSACINVHPLVAFGLCPGCGFNSTGRNDSMEGSYSADFTGVIVHKDTPVTILDDYPKDAVAFSASNYLGYIYVDPKASHVVGKALSTGDIRVTYNKASRLYFAKADLVRRLLEAGAPGLGFRPVHIVSECPD